MKNYAFLAAASLCLVLTSCLNDDQTTLNNVDLYTELEARSSNNILLSYTTASGPTSTACTFLEVSYQDGSTASLTIVDGAGTTTTVSGNNVQVTPSNGYELDVTKDAVSSFTAGALDIASCESVLCYSSPGLGLSGTGLDFIIDDIPIGM